MALQKDPAGYRSGASEFLVVTNRTGRRSQSCARRWPPATRGTNAALTANKQGVPEGARAPVGQKTDADI